MKVKRGKLPPARLNYCPRRLGLASRSSHAALCVVSPGLPLATRPVACAQVLVFSLSTRGATAEVTGEAIATARSARLPRRTWRRVEKA